MTSAPVKDWLTRWTPLPYLWTRQLAGRLYEPDVRRVLLQRYGSTVFAGPFAGMRYIERASGGAFIPRLVGVYERELHDLIQHIVQTPYDRVIDIGSAEGYYAVGLARAMPHARIQAYDIDETARRNLLDLATLNGMQDRIEIGGACAHADLERFASEAVVVLCDIEGSELELLDPVAAPSLRRYDILVEIHDQPGRVAVREALLKRFEATHDVRIIAHDPAVPDVHAAFPWWFTRRATRLALNEYRAPQAPLSPGSFGLEWGAFFARERPRR